MSENLRNKIQINVVSKMTSAQTINYKIILMKTDPDVSDFELGDMNMDGQVDQADYDLMLAFVQGNQTITDKQFKLGDMNSDGKIDSGDLNLLNQKIGGNSVYIE